MVYKYRIIFIHLIFSTNSMILNFVYYFLLFYYKSRISFGVIRILQFKILN